MQIFPVLCPVCNILDTSRSCNCTKLNEVCLKYHFRKVFLDIQERVSTFV